MHAWLWCSDCTVVCPLDILPITRTTIPVNTWSDSIVRNVILPGGSLFPAITGKISSVGRNNLAPMVPCKLIAPAHVRAHGPGSGHLGRCTGPSYFKADQEKSWLNDRNLAQISQWKDIARVARRTLRAYKMDSGSNLGYSGRIVDQSCIFPRK